MTNVTPFELAVVVRIQLAHRPTLLHFLAVEAAMEELAATLGISADHARIAGLGLGIDARLCQQNDESLGVIARELLSAEGVEVELVQAIYDARQGDARTLAALPACLAVVDVLVDTANELLEAGFSVDQLAAEHIRGKFTRAARAEGRVGRAQLAAERLRDAHGIDIGALAQAVVAGMATIRDDLAPGSGA